MLHLQVQNYFTDVRMIPRAKGEPSTNGVVHLRPDFEQLSATGSTHEEPAAADGDDDEAGSCDDSSAQGTDNHGARGRVTLPIVQPLQQPAAVGFAREKAGKRCLVMCMELCDQGSLNHAIMYGAFLRPTHTAKVGGASSRVQ